MPEVKNVTVGPRPRFKYQVPDASRVFEHDIRQFVMVPLTAGEEKTAVDTAEGSRSNVLVELVKHAVVEVDGKKLTWDGTDRDWIDRAGPKVRELVFAAFSKVNRPSEKETADFLATEVVEAG